MTLSQGSKLGPYEILAPIGAGGTRQSLPATILGQNRGVSHHDRDADDPPFPDSLCHECAAPPRYIRTERSTFIYCPILRRYPAQPVRACEEFVPKGDGGTGG